MKRKMLLISVLVIAVASIAGGMYDRLRTTRVMPSDPSASDYLNDSFKEALDTVQESYAGLLDMEKLGKASIQSMLHQLDPHSAFFTKAEFDDLQTEQRSRIYGIGVTIARRSDRVCITSVIPGGPAHRAGIKYGDAITAIDGQNTEEWTSDQVMHRVRGERGEPVQLTVERVGSPAPITASIRRDEVRLPSVRNAFMLDQSGTGYIALTGGFSSKTDEELTAALAKLKQDGMRQMVLDLRGNPGGLLEQAVEVSKKFLLPGQKIVEVRGREDRFSRVHEVPENNLPELIPLVLLINRQTASASEVVAGALQDHARATIVGESSFGKGLVQSVNRLWGGTGLTLTIAKYYTPSGRLIQRNYSDISFYDYYQNRDEDEQGVKGAPKGDIFYTDTGEPVYGGGGIAPNVEAKSPDADPIRNRLFFGIFDFARHLVTGHVTGFRQFRIGETQNKAKLTDEDLARFRVTDELLAAFRQHIALKPQFDVTEEQLKANRDYIASQLRRELITAAYGVEAGDQSFLYDDPQLHKAIESFDKARILADNARAASRNRQ